MKNLKLKIKNWVFANRREAFFLVAILIIGAFFRLHRIDEYMTFLGDEGRDAIVVRRLLVNFDPILIGPGTSIGNMYLGPLYYYLMAPSLLLSNFSPVGPAIMIALLGVATIFFVWFVAREWFPVATSKGGSLQGVYSINIGALVAAGLYAISPVVITYSRSSWNPNIMPFFALLSIYAIWRVWTASAEASARQAKWLIVLGISYAFVLQSHYLGLLLLPTLGLFWFLSFLKVRNLSLEIRNFWRMTLISVILFVTLMSPLVIFDARHEWRNFGAINTFFTHRQETVSARPWLGLYKVPVIAKDIVTRLVSGTNKEYGGWASVTLLIGLVFVLTKIIDDQWKNSKQENGFINSFLLLFVWAAVGLLGLAAYKQHIYDHYYGFLFTAPHILIGGISQIIINTRPASFVSQATRRLGVFFIFLMVSYSLLINLQNNPLRYPPNRQLQRTEEIAQKIVDEAGAEKLNLAVLAERNYEDAYQYFLERWNAPFVEIDPQREKETVADQLFVVCELSKEKCDPTHSPKAEIANFGWSKIEDEWQIAGITLYKLTHSQ